jgi:hypothetical protein
MSISIMTVSYSRIAVDLRRSLTCTSPDIHEFGQICFSLEKWRDRFTVMPRGLHGQKYMMVEYELISTIDEDNWKYEIQVLGCKTEFKDGGRITAGFRLSQGSRDE